MSDVTPAEKLHDTLFGVLGDALEMSASIGRFQRVCDRERPAKKRSFAASEALSQFGTSSRGCWCSARGAAAELQEFGALQSGRKIDVVDWQSSTLAVEGEANCLNDRRFAGPASADYAGEPVRELNRRKLQEARRNGERFDTKRHTRPSSLPLLKRLSSFGGYDRRAATAAPQWSGRIAAATGCASLAPFIPSP
jgi:hypothetical protein